MATRNTQSQSIQDVFSQFLNTYKLGDKYNETYVVAYWERIMGKTIASRTDKIYIKNRILFLKISSASLKQDLIMSKSRMIELLNEEAGQKIIDEIMFL